MEQTSHSLNALNVYMSTLCITYRICSSHMSTCAVEMSNSSSMCVIVLPCKVWYALTLIKCVCVHIHNFMVQLNLSLA